MFRRICQTTQGCQGGDTRSCARLSAAALTIVLAGWGGAAEAVGTRPVATEDLAPDGWILLNPTIDLVVLEIRTVYGGHSGPLKATVRIVDVLRGRTPLGEEAIATWDWPGTNGRSRYLPPKSAARVLAGVRGGRWRDGRVRLSIVDAYEASPQNIRIARRHMAPPEPAPWLLVAAPAIGWALLAVTSATSSRGVRMLLVGGASLAAAATLALYYDYERGMSPYTTIRIDLFFVWPAVAAALLIPVGAWWVLRRRVPGGADGTEAGA